MLDRVAPVASEARIAAAVSGERSPRTVITETPLYSSHWTAMRVLVEVEQPLGLLLVIVKQLAIPLFVHVERVVMRNLMIFAHNVLIVPLVLLLVGNEWSWVAFLSIVGLSLVVVNMLWIALLAGILCTRYRDLPQIITNALQVAFYVTPIVWTPALLKGGRPS